MADRQNRLEKDGGDDQGSRTSSVPLLGEGFQEQVKQSPRSQPEPSEGTEVDAKTGKRRFWGLGKKKEDDKMKKKKESETTTATSSTAAAPKSNVSGIRPASPLLSMGTVPYLSQNSSHPYSLPSSPGRNLNSSSPAPPSPASSQIFERNVQEDSLATAASPAIPAHITTENHIPPVLDASSAAITDDHLNPDEVEIVMHAAHQPAAVTVTGTGPADSLSPLNQEELLGHADNDETASTYGALDTTDVRRLSFISFADVVHAEHTDHTGSVPGGTISPVISHNRSPSPARSPLSSQALTGSPVLSSSVSSKGLEMSPSLASRGLTSPIPSQSPPTSGELTIETMRQALRKTGSGDLSGAKSGPTSAVGNEDGSVDFPLK